MLSCLEVNTIKVIVSINVILPKIFPFFSLFKNAFMMHISKIYTVEKWLVLSYFL